MRVGKQLSKVSTPSDADGEMESSSAMPNRWVGPRDGSNGMRKRSSWGGGQREGGRGRGVEGAGWVWGLWGVCVGGG